MVFSWDPLVGPTPKGKFFLFKIYLLIKIRFVYRT